MNLAARLRHAGAHALRTLTLCALLVSVAGAQPADDPGGWDFEDVEETAPSLLDLAANQAVDIALLVAFATLVMVSFFRKSRPLRYVTLVASVLYLGYYKSLLLSVVNVFGTLRGDFPPFAYSMAWYVFAGFAVVTTVLWGRIYCGRVCAFGAFTQLLDAVVPARLRVNVPPALERRASYIKYGILFAAVAYSFVATDINFYRYIEPFWMFPEVASVVETGSSNTTTVLWVMLGVLLVASIFVRNLYCRFLCPLGAALGLLSKLTVFKIKRWSECSQCALCEKTCEWGAIRKRQIVLTECVRCDDCERLYDDKTRCPHWLLELKRKRNAVETAAR